MKYEVVITYENSYRYLVEAASKEEAVKIAYARNEKDDDDGMCFGEDYSVCVADED